MSRLPALARETLDEAQRALFDRIAGGPRGQMGISLTNAEGGLIGPFNAYMYAPALGAKLEATGSALRETKLSARHREIAILTSARHHQAQFEWYAHALIAERAGFEKEIVAAIHAGDAPPFPSESDAAVYAFARTADDFADEPRFEGRRRDSLDRWGELLEACYHREIEHPVFVALQPVIERHDLPIDPFSDLISAFEQDQVVNRYDTWDQLVDYCSRSADPVGRLVLMVCGEPRTEEARATADVEHRPVVELEPFDDGLDLRGPAGREEALAPQGLQAIDELLGVVRFILLMSLPPQRDNNLFAIFDARPRTSPAIVRAKDTTALF